MRECDKDVVWKDRKKNRNGRELGRRRKTLDAVRDACIPEYYKPVRAR